MALAYLLDPQLQFSDKSGALSVAGFLRVYINGTDDLAVTYKDFNGTLNTADIVLDDNGRAVVIADSSKTYRLEVYNRLGGLMWTQYPINTIVGGAGGADGIVVESTDGSIQVDKYNAGGLVHFDLSTEGAQELEWTRTDNALIEESAEGVFLLPVNQVEGNMTVDCTGILLKANVHYDVSMFINIEAPSTAVNRFEGLQFRVGGPDAPVAAVTFDNSYAHRQVACLSCDVHPQADTRLRVYVEGLANGAVLSCSQCTVHSLAATYTSGGGGGDYEGGTGILVNNTTREISVDSSVVALKSDLSQYVTDSELETILEGYVTAGDGISVTDGKVSIDMVENHGLSFDYPAYETAYSTSYDGTQWLKFDSTFTAPDGGVSISTASTSFNLDNSLGTYTGCHLRFALAREVTGEPGEIIYLGKKNLKSMGTEVVVNGIIVNCPYGLDGGSGEWDDMWEATTTPPSDIGYCGIVAVDDNGNIVGNPLTMPRERSLNITMTSLHGKLKLDNPMPSPLGANRGDVLTIDYMTGNPAWYERPRGVPPYSASDSQKTLAVGIYGSLEWTYRLPGQVFVLPDDVYSEYNNIPGWSWTSFRASIDANVASGTPMMVVRQSDSNHPAGETAFYYHATHDSRLSVGEWVYVFGTVIAKDKYNFSEGPSDVPMPGQVTYTFYKYGEDNVRVSIENKPILYCPSMDYVQDGSVLTVEIPSHSSLNPANAALSWARREDVPLVNVDYRYDHEQHDYVLRTDINTLWSDVVTTIMYGRTPALSVDFHGDSSGEQPYYGRHRFIVETTNIREDYSTNEYYGSVVFTANVYDQWNGTWSTYSGVLSKTINATPTLTWETLPAPTIGTVTV